MYKVGKGILQIGCLRMVKVPVQSKARPDRTLEIYSKNRYFWPTDLKQKQMINQKTSVLLIDHLLCNRLVYLYFKGRTYGKGLFDIAS